MSEYPVQQTTSSNDRNMTILFTLGCVFIGVFSSLIGYLVAKDGTPGKRQMVHLLNFQITVTIMMVILMIISSTVVLSIIAMPLMAIVGVFDVIMLIVGTIKASNEQPYQYPLTINLLK